MLPYPSLSLPHAPHKRAVVARITTTAGETWEGDGYATQRPDHAQAVKLRAREHTHAYRAGDL